MAYQESVNLTTLTEAYLDEANKQNVMKYATAAARNADANLSAVCREGMLTYQDDTNQLFVQRDATLANVSAIGPVHGALLTWTPVVTQLGGVTVTNTYSRYTRFGRLCIGWMNVTVTGSGTGANAITVPPPITSAATNLPIGTGELFDSSAGLRYPFNVFLPTTNTMDFRSIAVDGMPDNRSGLYGFVAGLAVNDTIGCHFMYELGADS